MIKKIKKITSTDNKKRIINNFLSLVVLRGFQFLIPLFTLPYLVRTIGIEKFGLVNFALSLALYFGAIIKFGFGITATREIARHRDDATRLAEIYSATLTASVLIALVCAVIFGLIVLLFEKFNNHITLYLFTLAFIVFQSLLPIWFFQGMEKMKYITFLSIGTSAIYLISLFAFVRQEQDFMLVPLLNAVAALITFIIAITLIKKQFKVKFIRPKNQEIKAIYQNGRHAFVGQLAPNLYNNSAVFLLGLFTNNTVVGVYTATTKVIDAVIAFAYIISNTFLPYLSRNIQKHKVFQKIMLASGLLLTVATFIMAEWIAKFLFNADYIEIATYIQMLAVSILFAFIYLTYNTNYLMIAGHEEAGKNISLYVSLATFLFASVFIYLLGILGAVTSLLLARASLSLFSFINYQKALK